MIPRILIAGVGNILLQDDGLGPHAIARLQTEYEFGDEVELLDIGTPTLDFVDYLRERDVLILIDALSAGGEPGDILTFDQERLRQFLPGDAPERAPALPARNHAAAEMAGIVFKEALLIGVVGRDFNVTTELSEVVEDSMPIALELIAEIVRQRRVHAQKRPIPLPNSSWWAVSQIA